MTTVNSEVVEHVVCGKRETSATRNIFGKCVLLHFPGSSSQSHLGNAPTTGRLDGGHVPEFNAESSGLELVELGNERYAFSGANSDPILMSINSAGAVKFSQQSSQTTLPLFLRRSRGIELNLAAGEHIVVKAEELRGWPVGFTGDGRVDIDGVDVLPTVYHADGVAPAMATPDISLALSSPAGNTIVRVNRSVADTIKARWIYLERAGVQADDGEGRDYWHVIAKMELALHYVEFLNGGGRALDDFTVHIELDATGKPAWHQSLHDNLLGELNQSTLRARIVHNAHLVPEQLALTREGLFQLYFEFAGPLVDRPYCAGRYPNEPDSDCASIAFDFNQRWSRSDYCWRGHNARVTSAAVPELDGFRVGGCSSDKGFLVARHEGAGVELALRASTTEGVAPSRVLPQGICVYTAGAGPSALNEQPWASAKWHIDISVCTRLRGVSHVLDDFQFLLEIHRSSSTHGNLQCQLELTCPGSFYHPKLGEIDVGRAWLLRSPGGGIAIKDDGMLAGGIGDEMDEQVGHFVSRSAVNVGLPFLRRLLEATDAARGAHDPDILAPAIYDIRLEAYTRCGALLIDNHIQVHVT